MTLSPAASRNSDTPRRGRPGYDRQTLVDVCVEMFNRHGYEATSMGMLATELGISKSAIYHHVESKEEILHDALARALDGLEEGLHEAEAGDGSGAQRLEAALQAMMEVLLAQMPSVTLLLRLRGNSEVETAALARRRLLTRRMARLIEEGQQDGTLREDVSAGATARLVLGMVNSLVDWYKPGQADDSIITETVLKLAFSGLESARD